MVDAPEPISVETEEYIHARYREPDGFETIRTPDWADNASDSVSEGSEVRTGKRKDSDDWEVQSILIRKNVGEEKAREYAGEILRKIESWSVPATISGVRGGAAVRRKRPCSSCSRS